MGRASTCERTALSPLRPDRKPKAAKVNVEEEDKKEVGAEAQKVSTPRATTSSAIVHEDSGTASSASGEKENKAMKDVLQEAPKMLRSRNVQAPGKRR